MPLSLTKRVANGSPLTNIQHDANLTAIEGAVNTNTTSIADHETRLDDLEDTTDPAGAALNSQFEGLVTGKQTIDWDNVVNKPTDTPDAVYPFRAKKTTSDQIVAGNSSAIISFDAEDFDINSVYDTTASEWTAQVDGFYQFNYSAQLELDSGTPTGITILVSLRVNGAPADQCVLDLDDNLGVRVYKGGTLLRLEEDDVVDVYIDISQTGSADWKVAANPENTFISGFLVQAE